ncbi:MAG: hypothetical protein WC164_00785 [Patescibacteria group bacterium]
MKKIIFILIFIVCLFIASYFLLNKSRNQSMNDNSLPVIVLGSEPSSLDPAKSLTIDARSYLASLFEGLVNIDKNWKVPQKFDTFSMYSYNVNI